MPPAGYPAGSMAPHDFSACIVTYRSDARLLGCAVGSLGRAIEEARAAGLLRNASLFVVDNGDGDDLDRVRTALGEWPASAGSLELVTGQGNVGYGRANNVVLERPVSDVHLVMNP